MKQKKARILSRYEGVLTDAEVAHGMNTARRNAKRLYEDAKTLFDAKRIPTACSLAILSIEEANKVSQLRMIATASDERKLKQAWRNYRDHQKKNATWILTELAAKGAKSLVDLLPIFDPRSDHPAVLDALKQTGFYTDCYVKGHWSEPDNVVSEPITKLVLMIAKVSVPKREATEREVQLWREHTGKNVGAEDMVKGVLEFEKAMIAEGLSPHTIEKVERFYDPEKFKDIKL